MLTCAVIAGQIFLSGPTWVFAVPMDAHFQVTKAEDGNARITGAWLDWLSPIPIAEFTGAMAECSSDAHEASQ